MKVFISWSGPHSKKCAEILRDWIKCALQASDPWISSKDIDKGTLWFNEISDQLANTSVGIVCLTADNKDKPWILFESGALAKGLSINKVCTLLIDLKPSDLDAPLSQFNHTTPDQESMKSLLISINKEIGENALDDRILDQVFETYWPNFEEQFAKIEQEKPKIKSDRPVRSSEDLLEEILYTTRTMDKRIRSLERGDMEVRRNHRMSKEELYHQIENMISHGLNPDDIKRELKGAAPSGFIMERVIELWERRKQLELNDSDENT
tara:strand:- start:692 stop:1489 length:798 start_codon:yes stop_codon:yes gene_type:complete